MVIGEGIVFRYKQKIHQRVGFCKQIWIMVHHFVTNFIFFFKFHSKITFLNARLQRI